MNKQPRDLCEVIDNILKYVPDSRPGLKVSLRLVQESSKYRAPEIMSWSWREAESVLSKEIPAPAEEWERRVQDIFLGMVDA
jgi:hypothetical protein